MIRNKEAPYRARKAVTAWVGAEHPALSDVVLAVSELVTNSVTHVDAVNGPGFDDPGCGRDWVEVGLSDGQAFLRLTVTDPGSPFAVSLPVPRQRIDLTQTGRGLHIVNDLSSGRWGTHLLPGTLHRVVWCHLDSSPATGPAPGSSPAPLYGTGAYLDAGEIEWPCQAGAT
ncbi:ATP-binding protein [Nonomuraea sp. NPDC046570]|uniref:ATP-binding protein n=1 Tax=Nonomuraea sp. NPDC046570 TaxID=3155255 RepID=UPI0033DC6642